MCYAALFSLHDETLEQTHKSDKIDWIYTKKVTFYSTEKKEMQ